MGAKEVEKKIRSRGYWRVVIRPSSFIAERARLRDLEQIARDTVVQLRGWDYPHFPRDGVTRGNDFIEALTDSGWIQHIELWRLYQSGQFVHLFAMREDWLEGVPVPGLGVISIARPGRFRCCLGEPGMPVQRRRAMDCARSMEIGRASCRERV